MIENFIYLFIYLYFLFFFDLLRENDMLFAGWWPFATTQIAPNPTHPWAGLEAGGGGGGGGELAALRSRQPS